MMPGELDGLTSQAVKAVYSGYAHLYNRLFGAVFQAGRKAALAALELRPGDKVLEVGVGTGLALGLYPPGVAITGIDLTPAMLSLARQRALALGLKADLRVMDAQAMAFKARRFDAVVAMYVATVAPDPRRLLSEMRRVLKPGGRLVLVNHFSRRGSWSERAEAWLAPLSSRLGWRPLFYLEDFLALTGLKPLRLHRTGWLRLFTVLEARR